MAFEASMTIGGKPATSGDWIEVRNPADLSVVVGRYPNGTVEHAAAAVQAAHDAFPAWAATPAEERGALLAKAANLLNERCNDWAPLLTAENGKTFIDSFIDLQLGVMALSYYAPHAEWLADKVTDDGTSRLVVKKVPYGVVAAIIPWNTPIGLAAGKIGPALMAGNTMVLKVPEFAPLATLDALAAVAGVFPPGVLNVVSGFGPEVGSALVKDRRVRKVAFVGSCETGKLVMADAATHMASVSLELGGNDPAVVLDDAVIDEEMIKRVVLGAFGVTGQICFAIKRLYVHESRYDELVAALRAAVDQTVVGDGMQPGVTMGPFNNERQFTKVRDLLAATRAAGHEVVELGRYADGVDPTSGYFMLPHLVLNPPDDAAIVSCEQMGPVLPVMKFADDDEIVRRVNDSEYGLSSSVWSADRDRAYAVGARIEAGTTFINGHTMFSIDVRGPFGGHKESGIGSDFGDEIGLTQYTQHKTITNSYVSL